MICLRDDERQNHGDENGCECSWGTLIVITIISVAIIWFLISLC